MNEAQRMRKIYDDNQALLKMSEEDAKKQKISASVFRMLALKDKSDLLYKYDFMPRIESSAVHSKSATIIIAIIGIGTSVLNLSQAKETYYDLDEDAMDICILCKNILIIRGFKANIWCEYAEADEHNNRDKIYKLKVEW